jgi:hypothetical protein
MAAYALSLLKMSNPEARESTIARTTRVEDVFVVTGRESPPSPTLGGRKIGNCGGRPACVVDAAPV